MAQGMLYSSDLHVQLDQIKSSVLSDNEAESSGKAADQYTPSLSRLHSQILP